MPIINVEIVNNQDESIAPDLASRLAEAVGQVFGGPTGQTWVRLRLLPMHQYAENGGGPPADLRPVFVTVLKARLPAGEALQREIEQLTGVIAQVCDRPAENVHIFYEPEGRGRVAFGGRLVI